MQLPPGSPRRIHLSGITVVLHVNNQRAAPPRRRQQPGHGFHQLRSIRYGVRSAHVPGLNVDDHQGVNRFRHAAIISDALGWVKPITARR
ncbi:hypothetical protein GCM10027269_44560 [Kribbella endophytica]